MSLRQVKVDSAIVELIGISEGTLIEHKSLAKMLDVTSCTNEYYGMVESLRKKLIKHHKIFLKTIHKEGYRILPAGQTIEIPESVVDRGKKLIFKGVKSSGYLPYERMNETELNATIPKVQKLANLSVLLTAGSQKRIE